MIIIVRGPRSSLASATATMARASALAEAVEQVDLRAAFTAPWLLARRLLPMLRARFGDEAVDEAIAPQRAALSLALRGLAARLAPQERIEREAYRAPRITFAPHAGATPWGSLPEAFASTFARLLGDRRIAIVVPNIALVDPESMRILRPLMREPGTNGVRFVLGHDPRHCAGDRIGACAYKLVVKELHELESLSSTTVVAADDFATMGEPESVAPLDPCDDDLEVRAWQALADGAADARVLALEAARAAFDSFGFPAALRLLEGDSIEHHELAAASAHYLGLYLEDAAERCEHHFGVLASSGDAEQRAHAHYHLSLLTAKKKGDLARARGFAQEALDGARAIAPDRAPFFETWALNALAYSSFRQGQIDKASDLCERALALVSSPRPLAVPALSLSVTRWHLLHNLVRVGFASRDDARTRRTLEALEACEATIPPRRRPSTHLWVEHDGGDPRTKLARDVARLEQARRDLDPWAEALYAHSLGVLHYKLGEAAAAYEYFMRTLSLWRLIYRDPDDIAIEEMNCAVSAFRAGRIADAEGRFEQMRSQCERDSAEWADLGGVLAVVAARNGDHAHADRRAREALAAAVAIEDETLMVSVSRSIAEAFLLLGRTEAAKQHFEQARAIAAACSDVPAEDRFAVAVAVSACDADMVVEAVRLAPEALREPNAWWELPRFVRALRRAGGPDAVAARVKRADLEQVMAACAQRSDCAELLVSLQRCAPPPHDQREQL